MKRIFTLLILFVALGVSTSKAQYTRDNNENETRRYEPGVYQDDRGEYRWQTVERRVWIPEYRTPGIFGIGSRIIPGHYEMRTSRVRVYTDSNYENRQQGWVGKHPHGMPPGQRKKMQRNREENDQRWNNEDEDHHSNKRKGNRHDDDRDEREDRD